MPVTYIYTSKSTFSYTYFGLNLKLHKRRWIKKECARLSPCGHSRLWTQIKTQTAVPDPFIMTSYTYIHRFCVCIYIHNTSTTIPVIQCGLWAQLKTQTALSVFIMTSYTHVHNIYIYIYIYITITQNQIERVYTCLQEVALKLTSISML